MTAITVQVLPIATIAAPSYVRTQNGHDKESLSQLAASINQHGLLQPIVVRPMSTEEAESYPQQGFAWVIVAGRRRIAACKLAGMTEIAALVTDTDEARAYELEIAENIQREQMTLADTARAVRTLMTIYDSGKKVGEVLNKSAAWVSKHLAVTSSKCPPAILDLMDRAIVTDLETLILLKHIAELPASHPAATATMTRMLRIAHEGNMNRQIARDALAKLKAPAGSPPVAKTTTTQTVSGEASTTETTDEALPKTHFTMYVPIELMAAWEELGGADWLIGQLKAASNTGA